MKAIFKVMGVPVENLVDLKRLMAGDNCQDQVKKARYSSISNQENPVETIQWAKVISSKSNDGEQYVVEIELVLAYQVTNPILLVKDEETGKEREREIKGIHTMYPSIKFIEDIYKALGVFSPYTEMKKN